MPKWWLVFMAVTLVVILAAVRLDPQSALTPVVEAPTPGFAVVVNDYPAEAVVRFDSVCTKGGTPLSTCVCLLHGMENRYSYVRFQELVAADNPKAPEYAIVAQGCVGQ